MPGDDFLISDTFYQDQKLFWYINNIIPITFYILILLHILVSFRWTEHEHLLPIIKHNTSFDTIAKLGTASQKEPSYSNRSTHRHTEI